MRRKLTALFDQLGSNPRLAFYELCFTLVPDNPLDLAPDVAIRSPADIFGLVARGAPQREVVLAALRGLVADGHLGEWLRAIELESGDHALAAMDAARRGYPKEQNLPFYALRWHEASDLGLPVDGEWVKSPTAELAAWMERDATHRERALALLDRGCIPTWFARLKGPKVARDFGSLLAPELTRAALAARSRSAGFPCGRRRARATASGRADDTTVLLAPALSGSLKFGMDGPRVGTIPQQP